jgi:hypothetical protein
LIEAGKLLENDYGMAILLNEMENDQYEKDGRLVEVLFSAYI